MSEPAATVTERPAPSRPDPAVSDSSAPPKLTSATAARWWRWGWIALVIVSVPTLAVLFGFNPSHHGFYPFCAFHRMTGMQCPGCGGLRAVHHLLHGEVITAFRFNPLFVLALPVAAVMGVRRLLRGPGAQPLSHRAKAHWGWAAFVILVVFWIVRNLPLEIFRLPGE